MSTVAAVKKAPDAAGAEAPKKKGKLVIIIVAVLVLAIGGAAAWYFTRPKHTEDDEAEAPPKAAKQAATKPPVFLPLDQFVVNLQAGDASQFLQVALTIKVDDQAIADALKLHMPDIRNRILLLLSGKKASEIATIDGKQKLAEEIAVAAAEPIAPKPAKKSSKKKKAEADDEEDASVKKKKAAPSVDPEEVGIQAVLFTSFIIQ